MYQRILVPLDGSATSTQGLDEAIRLAAHTSAKLRLLHIVNELKHAPTRSGAGSYVSRAVPLMKEVGDRILDEASERAKAAGVAGDTMLFTSLAGQTASLVIEEALDWNCDLIVLGTHGRDGLDRLLWGSDAEEILRRSPVPVLMVRVPEGQGSSARTDSAPGDGGLNEQPRRAEWSRWHRPPAA